MAAVDRCAPAPGSCSSATPTSRRAAGVPPAVAGGARVADAPTRPTSSSTPATSCYEDPDDDADRAFAQRLLDRRPAPTVAIPGNHDVGLASTNRRADGRRVDPAGIRVELLRNTVDRQLSWPFA